MNYFFLVEGEKTEVAVYPAWLSVLLPSLAKVENVRDLTADTYVLVAGYGYPNYVTRIEATMKDLVAYAGAAVDRYVVCVDAEDWNYAARKADVLAKMNTLAQATGLLKKFPNLQLHCVVQTVCMESWFLGNRRAFKRTPASSDLAQMIAFYDVRVNDPENMPTMSGYVTKASFHLKYLRLMLAERNGCYSKRNPSIVCNKPFLTQLIARHLKTSHLASLGDLLAAL